MYNFDPIYVFPTVLENFRLEGGFKPEEIQAVIDLDWEDNSANSTSVRKDILEMPEFSRINQFIQTALAEYFDRNYKPLNPMTLRTVQSWANKTRSGEAHHYHTHSNSFLSAVLYVQVEEGDCIHFLKHERDMIEIEPREFTQTACRDMIINVDEACLLVFPSKLMHGVPNRKPNSVKSRLSIALNVFPVGLVGDPNNANALELR